MSISFSSAFPSNITVTNRPLDKPLSANSAQSQVEADFLKEAHKTPAERIQEALLKKLGVTPEQYAAMDGAEKAAIDNAIKQELLEQIRTGKASTSGNYTDQLA